MVTHSSCQFLPFAGRFNTHYSKNQVRPGIRPSPEFYQHLVFGENLGSGENIVLGENIGSRENFVLGENIVLSEKMVCDKNLVFG